MQRGEELGDYLGEGCEGGDEEEDGGAGVFEAEIGCWF